jgi:hypothetical protein
VCLDGTSVHLHEFLHERKSDAESAGRAFVDRHNLHKKVEDAFEIRSVEADAGVAYAHANFDTRGCGGTALTRCREPDATGAGRVLRGIAEQVAKELLQPHLIGPD